MSNGFRRIIFTFLRAPGIALIRVIELYQMVSAWFPARCRFYPSCSEYAKQAIRYHGVLKGGAYAIWRILRCHPLNSGGMDLVPEVALANNGKRSSPSSLRSIDF